MSDDAFGDAVYEVWCRGGNPDAVDRDEVDDLVRYGDCYDGYEAGEVIANRQMRKRKDRADG